MASNPSPRPDGENNAVNSAMSMLESLKLTLESGNKEVGDLRKALQIKEEEVVNLTQQNVQLSEEVSKLKKELIEIEARKEAEAEKKLNQLRRLMLTGLKMSFGGGDDGLPEMIENGGVEGDKMLKEVMKLVCEESVNGGSRICFGGGADGGNSGGGGNMGQALPHNGTELGEIAKILDKSKSSYVAKFEDLLKSNPEGLEAREFQRRHADIVSEEKKLLEMKIRMKGQEDQTEAYLKSLQAYVDDHWKYVLEANIKNLKKRKEREEQERKKHEEERRLERLRENERRKSGSLLKRTTITEEKSHSSQSSGREVRKQLPPLVFQLQHTRIKMGMLIDGMPRILANDSGEESTPFIVGLSKEGDILYGSEVLANIFPGEVSSDPILKKHWWVAEHLITLDGGAWNEVVQLNGSNGTLHKISVEFLLAFILRKMKEGAEATLNGTCSVAIITVPSWFCSTQRIQVKDGGRLAGFSAVYLINEATAATFACASSKNRPASANNILVISENAELVDASIYSCSSGPKVVMVGHCGNYSMEDQRKSVLDMFGLVGSANRLMNVADADTGNEDMQLQNVRRICKEAIQQSTDLKYNSVGDMRSPNEIFVISESEKWKSILEQVSREYARKVCDIDEENAVIIGATLLSQKPVEIQEKSEINSHGMYCENAEPGLEVVSFPNETFCRLSKRKLSPAFL